MFPTDWRQMNTTMAPKAATRLAKNWCSTTADARNNPSDWPKDTITEIHNVLIPLTLFQQSQIVWC